MTEVWSCGGGTQSTAIAILIMQRKLKCPDYALMTDTGRERQSTWDYFFEYTYPALSDFGLDIHLVDKSKYATKDLWGGEDRDITLMPTFSDIDGKSVKSPTYCSGEWKRDVAKRYMRRVLKISQCRDWLGISTDEMRRVRASREQWCQLHYPLIFDMPMSRQDCIELVTDFGWPKPPRSSCWMCPHMGDAEWADIKENYPSDFRKAIAIEKVIQSKVSGEFLHKSLTPIGLVEFGHGDGSMEGCNSGACFV